jgi:hypothetical protein
LKVVLWTTLCLIVEFKSRTVAGGPGVLLAGSSRKVNFGKAEFAGVEETERRGGDFYSMRRQM